MLSRGYLNYSNNSNITKLTRVNLLKSNLRKKIVQDRYPNEISATFSQNESQVNTEFLRAGPFIIGTNLLDSNELTHDSILSEYKAQQSCERGFAFLKDPLFFADSIFLKSPERRESLGMIMGLFLLVYTLGQRQIRTPLRESKSTVKNQLGKPTDRPTLPWIFPCFQSIHLVTLNQEKHICYWTQERDFIVNLLLYHCFPYYQLVT
jgi:transposase